MKSRIVRRITCVCAVPRGLEAVAIVPLSPDGSGTRRVTGSREGRVGSRCATHRGSVNRSRRIRLGSRSRNRRCAALACWPLVAGWNAILVSGCELVVFSIGVADCPGLATVYLRPRGPSAIIPSEWYPRSERHDFPFRILLLYPTLFPQACQKVW